MKILPALARLVLALRSREICIRLREGSFPHPTFQVRTGVPGAPTAPSVKPCPSRKPPSSTCGKSPLLWKYSNEGGFARSKPSTTSSSDFSRKNPRARIPETPYPEPDLLTGTENKIIDDISALLNMGFSADLCLLGFLGHAAPTRAIP